MEGEGWRGRGLCRWLITCRDDGFALSLALARSCSDDGGPSCGLRQGGRFDTTGTIKDRRVACGGS